MRHIHHDLGERPENGYDMRRTERDRAREGPGITRPAAPSTSALAIITTRRAVGASASRRRAWADGLRHGKSHFSDAGGETRPVMFVQGSLVAADLAGVDLRPRAPAIG
jgi:hypothetical protein